MLAFWGTRAAQLDRRTHDEDQGGGVAVLDEAGQDDGHARHEDDVIADVWDGAPVEVLCKHQRRQVIYHSTHESVQSERTSVFGSLTAAAPPPQKHSCPTQKAA